MKATLKFPGSFMILLIFHTLALAQVKTVTYPLDPAAIPPDLIVTLSHINAEVSFLPTENKVIAGVDYTISPNRYRTDSMVFYAPGFTIRSAGIDGIPVKWQMQQSSLVIYPAGILPGRPLPPLEKGKRYHLAVSYEAAPQAGAIYFVGWRPDEEGKRKQIWAHRPHGWLPYMDGRVTVDMKVTFDRGYKVFSNGERVSVTDNPGNTRTWHYRMTRDHPFFSTCLVIGDYDFKESRTSRGIPLEFWYYAGLDNKAGPTFKYTEQMFDFFEQEMGVAYPYPVYREAPVIDYMYGGMETTTATVFGDFMLIDPRAWWQRNYVNVNAHELAHQWFGNYILHLVNKDVWLTESFGTYYAKLFEKSIYGEDQYQNIRNEEMQLTFDAAKRNANPVGGSQGGVERIYRKGSLVLDMLRYVMGDKEFRDAVKYYLEKFGFGHACTADFIQSVYETGKKPYDWFFEEWVLHGGEPDYTVKYIERADPAGQRSTVIWVWQTQPVSELVGLFRMPIVFEVYYLDGSVDRKQVWVSEKFQEVLFPNPGGKAIDFVLFDPSRKILKKVHFPKGFEELSSQVMKAPDMIDRYDALLALRSAPAEKKRDLFIASFRKESFYLTKAEIIGQLVGDMNDPATVNLMQEALNDPDANVRKSVLLGVSPLPEALRKDAEQCLSDSSWLNIELALGNLSQSFPGQTARYLEMTKDLEGWRGKNIRMKWLEIAISRGEKKYLEELIPYSGPKYEFETRMNALNLLKKLRYSDEMTLANARQASQHWNNKLSAVGKEYLESFEKK